MFTFSQAWIWTYILRTYVNSRHRNHSINLSRGNNWVEYSRVHSLTGINKILEWIFQSLNGSFIQPWLVSTFFDLSRVGCHMAVHLPSFTLGFWIIGRVPTNIYKIHREKKHFRFFSEGRNEKWYFKDVENGDEMKFITFITIV